MKLGFSIGIDSLGYGVVIPHYGKIIGDGLYLSTGAKITSKIKLGNNISIGANSLVNKDCEQDNVLLGGMPAKVIKQEETWYIRDSFEAKVKRVEELRKLYAV